MAAQLIKTGARIVLGHPFKLHTDKILCKYCDQTYDFHYSDGEEPRLKEWLPKAQTAVNESHDSHPDSIPISF